MICGHRLGSVIRCPEGGTAPQAWHTGAERPFSEWQLMGKYRIRPTRR